MKHVKRLPPVLLTSLLVLSGFSVFLVGLARLFGLDVALIAGGLIAMVAGLLFDVSDD